MIEFQSLVFPESVTRNQIESWIHPEPEKRVEPSFRYGLALMAIAEKIGIYKKTAKPTPEPKKQ